MQLRMEVAQVGIPLHHFIDSEIWEQPARCWQRGIQQLLKDPMQWPARSANKLTYRLYSAGISDAQKREIVEGVRLPAQLKINTVDVSRNTPPTKFSLSSVLLGFQLAKQGLV